MNETLLPLQTSPAATGGTTAPAASAAEAETGEQTFPALFASVANPRTDSQSTEKEGKYSDFLMPAGFPNGAGEGQPGDLVMGAGQAARLPVEAFAAAAGKHPGDDEGVDGEATDGNILPTALPPGVDAIRPVPADGQAGQGMAPALPATLRNGFLPGEGRSSARPVQLPAGLATGTSPAATSQSLADSISSILSDGTHGPDGDAPSLLTRLSSLRVMQGEGGASVNGQNDNDHGAVQAIGNEWRGNGPVTRTGAEAGDRGGIPELRMERQLGSPGWNSELGNRVVWMARNEQQLARIRLNPPHMGPIEVKVSVHQDSANIVFAAHNSHAREAIEAAIPRLREMMAEQGFGSTQVDVSTHGDTSGRERQAGDGASPISNSTHIDPDDTGLEDSPAMITRLPDDGVVDFFV